MPDLFPVDLFDPPPEFPARSALRRDCTACGACCSAPDIHALGKPLGVPCRFLGAENAAGACLCGIYGERPPVCRSYAPDWVCGEVAPLPTLDARIRRFLDIYGLAEGGTGAERGR